MKKLIIVKTGSIKSLEKARASKNGYLIIENDNPEMVKFLDVSGQFESLTYAAVCAIKAGSYSAQTEYFSVLKKEMETKS